MKSIGLCGGLNGGTPLPPSFQMRRCHGCMAQVQQFLGELTMSPWRRPRRLIHRSSYISNPSIDGPHSYPEMSSHGSCEICKLHPPRRVADRETDEDVSKRLDKWVRISIQEIVSNLEHAPFLVHIYNDGVGSSSSTNIRLEKEKSDADNWRIVRGRWNAGSSAAPNGIILVEELGSKEFDGNSNTEDSASRFWGVLIQVRGENRKACYILKTCTIHTLTGICTHFCLAKISCFNESAETQLSKLWLQMY